MSGRHWTPYQVEIVLHHYCSPAPYEAANEESYLNEVHWMLERGILVHDDAGILRPTDIGEALVEMWLQTPLPYTAVIDPRDGKQVMREHQASYAETVISASPPTT